MKEIHLKIIEKAVIVLGIFFWIIFMLQLLGILGRPDLFWWKWKQFPAKLINPADNIIGWIIVNAIFVGILSFKIFKYRKEKPADYGLGKFFYNLFILITIILILDILIPLIWLLIGNSIPPFLS